MHHNSYGLVLTPVIEVRKHIVYILINVFIFLYWWLYNILSVMLSFQIMDKFYILEKFHILLFNRYLFLHNLILGFPYHINFPYLVKASIRKWEYLFKRNNNQEQKTSGLIYSLYVIYPFLTYSYLLIYTLPF